MIKSLKADSVYGVNPQSVMNNVKKSIVSLVNFMNKQNKNNNQKLMNNSITNVPFPRFQQGTPYFTILSDVQNKKGELNGVMIDGVSLKMGCKGAVYK